MLTIQNYVRAGSLEEAYALCQKKNNVVLGGMLWLKMQRNRVDTAIDLSGLGLDQIEETDSEYRLGAMVTLRQLELHPGLDRLTQGAMAESVRHIVGVQFRNLATVGGSVFGRFGFSDVLTLLLALEARVVLYRGGEQSLADFAAAPRQRGILTHVIIPKGEQRVIYLSQRNTATDFPVLTCALSRREGWTLCAVGARPGRAEPFEDGQGLLAGGITPEGAQAFARELPVWEQPPGQRPIPPGDLPGAGPPGPAGHGGGVNNGDQTDLERPGGNRLGPGGHPAAGFSPEPGLPERKAGV